MSTMDKANEILLGLLEKSVEAVDKGAEFLGEQIPLVVQELLVFKAFEHGLGVLIPIFVLFGLYKVFVKYAPQVVADIPSDYGGRESELSRVYHDVPATLIAVIGGTVSVITTVVCVTHLYQNLISFVKVLIDPRLYLLEYTSSLLN